MNNQTNKIDQKGKAIASLAIGIIGIISLFSLLSLLLPKNLQMWGELIVTVLEKSPKFLRWILSVDFMYDFIFIFFLSILGIFLGIKGLKSSKKIVAISGVILCTIDLIFSLFLGYYWLALLTPR